jgi:glycosyltransferase involved in cell wall biosynthesis
MACGLPVIGTDIGDTRDVVGDAGRIVPCGDALRLADEIVALAAMAPAQRTDLGALARDRIRSAYSIESVAARYGRLYHEIVTERRGRGERAMRETLPARIVEPAI